MDKAKIAETLRRAYSWEMHSITLYGHYAEAIEGPEHAWLADKFRSEMEESFGHAKKCLALLGYLGAGLPTEVSFPAVPEPGDVRAMLREALKNEQTAAETYASILDEARPDAYLYHEINHLLIAELKGVSEVRQWLGRA